MKITTHTIMILQLMKIRIELVYIFDIVCPKTSDDIAM